MPRFVVLSHDHPVLHWDLMLERGDALRTWRLLEKPGVTASIAAEALPDHRMAYLDYEGPVSGDRGTVTRLDRGTVEVLEERPEMLRLRFSGELLGGEYLLVCEGGDAVRWTLHSAVRDD